MALQAMLQQHPGRVAWEAQQRVVKGQRALRHRVERKTRKTVRIEELRAQIEHCWKQSGAEEQGGQGRPLRSESGLEEEWSMDVEDEIESRKKLDEQRRKLQKELRDVENSRVCRKRFRTTSRMTCSRSCREVERRRHALMLEHQKCRKDRKRYKAPRKKRNMQK